MESKVLVPKGLLAALTGVALAAVLGLVFLLGRISAPRALPAPPPGAPAPAALQPAAAEAPAPVPYQEPPGFSADGRVPPAVPPPLRPADPAAVPAAPRNDPERAAVAAYFQAVEALQPQREGNPEALAQQLMAGLGKGDSSDFDGMLQEAREARSRLAAITPPPACAGYHRDSLANLDAGLDLMRAIKAAMASADPAGAAAALADRGTALKTRSEALEAQERALKQRYRNP